MKTTFNTILEALEPNDTVYTLSETSSSNMTAYVRCFIVMGGEIQEITHSVNERIKYPWNTGRGAIAVGGCGFDRSFDVVYALSSAIFDGERAGYRLKHRRL